MLRFLAVVLVLLPSLCFPADYRVGPGQALARIGDVPWESLSAGDTVFIHAKGTPYAEKWVLNRVGTAAAPITVRGVPDGTGALPLITGENATTRAQLNYWNEDRGVLKIGGSNTPADGMPAYIVVEGLHIRRAAAAYTFTGRNGAAPYAANASAIFVEKGSHITIRGCEVEESGNGLFVASGTSDMTIEGNYIHGNGVVGSMYEHNTYTEARNILYQYNRFGPPCAGCTGNNLKDRSSGTVVRYNWIEGGSRQLDLVDSGAAALLGDPAYLSTYVYGNVLLELDDAGNSQILHFGGDSGSTANYRGTLYLWNNTLVSFRAGNTTVVRLSSAGQTGEVQNNVVYVTASGNRLAWVDGAGTVRRRGNWSKPGAVASHSAGAGPVIDLGGNVTGAAPGFVAEAQQDYRLAAGSAAREVAVAPIAALSSHPLSREYVKHQQSQARPVDGALDIGAFEYGTSVSTDGGAPDGGGGGGGGGGGAGDSDGGDPDGGSSSADAGEGADADGGTDLTPATGCGCATSPVPPALFAALLLALALRRRARLGG
ncbi:MAG: right-handed parallel beta-helix repeat-containing protein [Myxococcaceae bacterium]